MLLILIVSQYSMFQKKLKYLLTIKTLKQTFSEYKHTNSVMCGYFCIGFIDFMFKGKTLTEYTNLFCSYDFKKNGKIILNFFKDKWK